MHLCIRVLRPDCRSKRDHHAMQPGLFCCCDSLTCQYHDLKHTLAVFLVYPSFLLCNSLPRLFETFPHFMKLPNKGFVLISSKYLLKNCQDVDSRLKQVLVFFFPPEVINLHLKSLFVDKLQHKGNKIFALSMSEKHTHTFDYIYRRWKELTNIT